jgi:hypothetical protein
LCKTDRHEIDAGRRQFFLVWDVDFLKLYQHGFARNFGRADSSEGFTKVKRDVLVRIVATARLWFARAREDGRPSV